MKVETSRRCGARAPGGAAAQWRRVSGAELNL
jgi:hypothetical protein